LKLKRGDSMKQRLPIIIIVLVVLVGGYLLWAHFANRNAQPAGTLPGNGIIEATEVDVTAEVSGKIKTLAPQEGDQVNQGQLIAVLDTGSLQGQVEQAQGNLQSLEANLAVLQAGTRPEDIQHARAQYKAAQQALRQAQAGRALVYAGPRPEEIAQLQAAYEQAVAQRDLLHAGTRPAQLRELSAAVEQAQAQAELTKAGPRKEDIAQIRAAYESALATQHNAETELQRMTTLEAQGAVAGQQVDLATTTRDVAAKATMAAKARLDAAVAGSRPQEIHGASAALTEARQRLADAQAGPRPQEFVQADKVVEAAHERLLEAKHGARPQERVQSDAAVAQAQDQLNAAQASYNEAVAGARPQDITAAKAKVAQAKGTLDSAATTRDETKIFAPASARVSLRNLEPGDLVTPGTPIVQLAELNQVWLRVYVPEQQVGHVKLGQRAVVTTDSYVGTSFEGKVTEIAEEPEFTPKNIQTKEERVKLVFGVKITIDNPSQQLKPGMPADALIYVGQ
jgi:multidrug resistance efflux pump